MGEADDVEDVIVIVVLVVVVVVADDIARVGICER